MREMDGGRAARGRGRTPRPWTRTCALLAALLCVTPTLAEETAAGAVAYSAPKLNKSYRASTEFSPQGMEHLYYVTNMFLDAIQKDDTAALDQHQLEAARKAGNLTQTLVHLGLYDWPTLVHHHLGYAIVAGVGIVVALLTPLIGLMVCCCRCSGKCGGRVEPYDKRNDKCRRWSLGIFLALLVMVILFGVVASFVVNEYVEKGVMEVPPRLHVAVDDSQLYVQNTKQEVNHLLRNNYMELTEVLDHSLEECGRRVTAQLGIISRAVAVDNLTAITEGLTDIRRDLTAIADQSELLQNKADNLQVGLQDAHAELSVLLRSCDSPRCRQVAGLYNLSQLNVENGFKELPDVTRMAREISDLIENGIEGEVRAGKRSFDELAERIQAEVATIVPEVRQSISLAGIKLQEVAKNITDVLDQVKLKPAHRAIDTGNEYLQQYGAFRYYVFLIISGLVLLVTFCLAVGLFCGFCGRRPGSVYGDGTCNKGTGANFLISGTFFYFLFGWLLLLLITCMFLLGGLAQFYLCDGLADPAAPGSGLAILQAVYPLEKLFPPLQTAGFDVAEVVRKCHRNKSIYTVLHLDPVFNVSEIRAYKHRLGLDLELERLRDRIRVETDVQILTPRGKEQLKRLAETQLAQINYTAFAAAMKERVTSLDLRKLGRELEDAARELPGSQRAVATKLRNQAIILMAYQRIVESMADIVDDIKNSTVLLQEHVKFNRTNVTEAVEALTAQAEAAQLYLRTRGQTEVTQLAEEFTAQFVARLDSYSDRVEDAFRRTLGRCGPLSTVYNSTAVTLCSNVIYPFNAFWAAVGWCLLLFIPCVIVSLAMTPLYRKSEPFCEGLMDAEYLYDAYGDQDNIPLANVREQRSGGGRRRDHPYENSRYHGYSPESPSYSAIPPRGQHFRPVGATSESEDTEPKAPPLWDLNGGPPGYPESPQATRERPPPYFASETTRTET